MFRTDRERNTRIPSTTHLAVADMWQVNANARGVRFEDVLRTRQSAERGLSFKTASDIHS